MVLSVPINTYTALQNARAGVTLVPRFLVYIKAKNRATGAAEAVGLSTDVLPMTFDVTRPDTGDVVSRVYQGMGDRLHIPDIPASKGLDVTTLSLRVSRLNAAVINAARAYDSRRRPLEIHMVLLDPVSRKQLDPAVPLWDGIIDKMPITRAKVGEDGEVEIRVAPHSRWLTIGSGKKWNAEFFEDRGDKAGEYISTLWKIGVPWGQDTVSHTPKQKPRERWLR
jgi:hypothetical protein